MNFTNGSYYTIGAWMKTSPGAVGFLKVNIFNSTGSYDSAAAAMGTATTTWTWVSTRVLVTVPQAHVRIFLALYQTQRMYIVTVPQAHVRIYADATPNGNFYVDGIIVSPDSSYSANESNDSTHLYQSFIYTPATVYSSSVFATSFATETPSKYSNNVATAKIDGATVSAWIANNLIYVDTSGLTAGAHTIQVTVTHDALVYVTAAFSANTTSGQIPLTVAFTDTSTGSPTSWAWNFGDGSTSTSQNPTHTYSTSGTYSVSLTATSANGADTETKNAYITTSSTIPTAAFSGSPIMGTAPLTVQFTDKSAGASPITYLWNFGDGNTSTYQNPSHIYIANGNYTVNLTITNSYGTNSTSKTAYIVVGTSDAANNTFRNYSQYKDVLFQSNMSAWDFVKNTKNFYVSFMPEWFFWLIILIIPYIGMYNRQGGIELVAVLYLFTGGIVALVMPTVIAPFAKWFLILGAGGVIYKMFVPD